MSLFGARTEYRGLNAAHIYSKSENSGSRSSRSKMRIGASRKTSWSLAGTNHIYEIMQCLLITLLGAPDPLFSSKHLQSSHSSCAAVPPIHEMADLLAGWGSNTGGTVVPSPIWILLCGWAHLVDPTNPYAFTFQVYYHDSAPGQYAV